MPRTTKLEAPVLVEEGVIEGRYVELDGYTVAHETHKADVDPAPLFQGLPGDRCQCPHWGVVVKGRSCFGTPTTTRRSRRATPYYGAPDHVPLPVAGTEVVEFSPSVELQQTMAVVGQNLEAVKAAMSSATPA